MKKQLIALALCVLFASGCAHEYVIKLSNGARLTAASKPKFNNGAYYYKDALGRTNSVPAGRVTEVEPASMAARENTFTQPSYPHPKTHWWQFWK